MDGGGHACCKTLNRAEVVAATILMPGTEKRHYL